MGRPAGLGDAGPAGGPGVPLGSLRLLEGRRTIPVQLFRFDGHDWLVSIFGETGWVMILRETGVVRLRRGRHTETFTAVEVDGEQSTAVVAQMRRQSERAPSKWVLNQNPPDHTRLRALMAPAFSPAHLGPLGSRIQYGDVYAVTVYLIDARGNMTRMEDGDLFH